ncbi:RNA binding methyltransferase FtsJ like [Lentilactobacillus kosonis]|uniref:RNA binding methyltransferase FtsJ like n=1 Tax=Lentilactobacillus kosonis TaxID=2810561 RepID=A0A401FKK2_9LACO|nr:RNA binding methyltransferase FtsJ like [Lentilactobacillus kosonis]
MHKEVLTTILDFAVETGFEVEKLDFSPIKGGSGNIEFLVLLKSVAEPTIKPSVSIETVIKNAYSELKKD